MAHKALASSRAVSAGTPQTPIGVQRIEAALVILRRKQVEARVGLSRSALYRRIAGGTFPKPVPLGLDGKAVGWVESEISAWLGQCVAARDSAA